MCHSETLAPAWSFCVCVCACVCVRACLRACVRACVCACVREGSRGPHFQIRAELRTIDPAFEEVERFTFQIREGSGGPHFQIREGSRGPNFKDAVEGVECWRAVAVCLCGSVCHVCGAPLISKSERPPHMPS